MAHVKDKSSWLHFKKYILMQLYHLLLGMVLVGQDCFIVRFILSVCLLSSNTIIHTYNTKFYYISHVYLFIFCVVKIQAPLPYNLILNVNLRHN